jgi:hypothetical protein
MQSIQTRRIGPALAVLTLLLSAQAQAADSQRSEGRRPMPPPEALAACESRESGAECSFSSDKGAVTGTC